VVRGYLSSLRTASRGDAGFGLVELMAAMTVMGIGILALFVMFQSSGVQLRRASTVTTAAALADSEMEKFRAVRFDTIGLAQSDVAAADGVYTGASGGAYKPISEPVNASNSTVVIGKCSEAWPCTTLVPTKTVTGADKRSYRVDTYVTWSPTSNQSGRAGRDVKLVTLVVREATTNRVYARISSSFDELSGV
jgi:prepilin-type N-terminal cleavage/methylation domain-containing protein